MIKCICSYSNYYNSEIRKQNYIEFRKHFHHDLITIELALDKSLFFIDDSIKILTNTNNTYVWQKERSFNLIIQDLPTNIDKIVWVDTDIIFSNENWLNDLEKLLDEVEFAQPFERVTETPAINSILNCESYASALYKNIHHHYPINKDFTMGLSWGMRRSCINNGFYDKHIFGANDALQVLALTGDIHNGFLVQQPKFLIKDFLSYYAQNEHYNGRNIGYCKGNIKHLFHGLQSERGYFHREQLLQLYNYDPSILKIDLNNGLYYVDNNEWIDISTKYFMERNIATKQST